MKEDKTKIINTDEFQTLFDKSKNLIDNARNSMGQMTNTITVITSFLLGKYIIEQEQQGAKRAKYGAKVIDSLSTYLMEEYALYLPDKKLLQKKLKEWLAEEQDKTSSITY